MRYIFPFKDIPADSRIVIYGATQTGYDFYRQVKSTDYCEVAAWIDRNYLWWREMNLPVNAPDSIVGEEYDTIVLTAETQRVAKSMKNDLIKLGVDENKIYWKDDYAIRENIAKGYDSERIIREAAEAVTESPLKYLNDETMDIVVRVMYADDLLNGRDSSKHRDMYRKLMMNQNNGKEPTEDMVHAYFTEYDIKRGWKAFDQSFRDLVFSIKDNGFDREHFIPIDSDGGLINGRHRLASAIANGTSVWTRKYLFGGFHFRFGAKWLSSLGFSEDEIKEITKEYRHLKNLQ